LTEAELRRFAALRLSDFKVPSRIVFLAEIPKGPTGKLQRIGLAEKLGIKSTPVQAAKKDGEVIAPRTESEARLLELWQEVLNRTLIGVTQRFLDVGGDSVLAAQLLSRLEASFDVRIEMLDFFDAPTISEQAVMIEALILAQLQNMSDNETAQFGSS
jgi:acyl carrier protein